MIIKCPNCNSNYEIEKKLLSQKGRKVKCFNCSNYWIQHVDGKVVKLNLEDSFSTELNRRENLIKNSLNKNKIISKKTNDKESIFSAQQEKELLSSLAISEIEKNRNSENNLSYTNSNSINRVENIKDKLKNKDEPHIIKDERGLNKSYLGFVIISIFFISGYFFYQKPEFFIGKNTIYEEELLVIKDYIDFFITNLIQVIKTQLMK
tara:strand:- start:55 stop:675 length:621 start_codon:yes stop_codon:yes gene_type:complete